MGGGEEGRRGGLKNEKNESSKEKYYTIPSLFYIRSNVNYILREELEIKPLVIFSIEVRNLSSKPFVIITWYRPPIHQLIFFPILIQLDSENVEH